MLREIKILLEGEMDTTIRREAITKALQEYRERGDTRTETLDFRGAPKTFEVVRINVDVPLLNHDNSRLRAQLATHPDREVVHNNPESAESQEILSNLLRRTEKFKELQSQLADKTQKRPGVITRDGMLVNGNTRLVALRDIGANGIDVAVLPEDATSTDFFEVEMSLQMVNLIEQPYTFTNQLLLVKSLRERMPNDQAIFGALNWQRNQSKRLQEHLRWLQLVEEMRQDSQLTYEYFDDKQEMIKNLDTAYQSTLAEDPSAAEALKGNRIFAISLGLNKDEVRQIDEEFVNDQISKKLDGKPEEAFFAECAIEETNSSLDELLGPKDQQFRPKINMQKARQKLLTLDADDPTRAAIYRAFKTGSRELIEQGVKEQIRTEPIEYLENVISKVEELTQNLPLYFADQEFKKGTFTYKAKKLQKALLDLEATLKRQLDG